MSDRDTFILMVQTAAIVDAMQRIARDPELAQDADFPISVALTVERATRVDEEHLYGADVPDLARRFLEHDLHEKIGGTDFMPPV